MLRIGIIGCGTIAQVRHAPEYQTNPDCELTAFYNHSIEKAEKMAAQYGGVCCSSIDELLKMDLDAVSVCTSNDSHAEITIRALSAGLHVLCEKPMAMSLEECERMAETAKKSGKILMIANNQRFDLAHQKAREMVAAGEIGDVISFETEFGHKGPDAWCGNGNPWFFYKERAGMGALGDLGIHKIDLAQHILGGNIVSVEAVLKTMDKKYPDGSLIDVEDNAWCMLEMESGITGSLHVSWTCYGKERNRFIVYGKKGIIRCYDDREYALIVEKDGEEKCYDLDGIQTKEDQGAAFFQNSGVINEFVSSIIEHRNPVSSGEENLNSMRAVFGAAESNRLHQRIKI